MRFSLIFCIFDALVHSYALVIPAGFEPTTHSLEGCCSIQLSYGTIAKITLMGYMRCKNKSFISFIQKKRPFIDKLLAAKTI